MRIRFVWIGAVAAALAATGLLPARATAPPTSGLPSGIPAAALAPEPVLPTPHGWPFADQFPRTMGTGRLVPGALEWTDFIFDDHGAFNGEVPSASTAGAVPGGTYTYPAGPAAGNGADIFRVGIGLAGGASYWRVDWNTLLSPAVPIAEFAIDSDDNPATGVSAWPAGAGVSSPGIDRAILISARGVTLIDAATGHRTLLGPAGVDMAAKSFVARIPASVLPIGGRWRVRIAAGLANAAGDGFALPAGGALPGQPATYNVGFRTYQQEGPNPPLAQSNGDARLRGNFWNDKAQGVALESGDVSSFSSVADWAALSRGVTTPAVLPTGWSDQWYVSSTDAGGQGVSGQSDSLTTLQPIFLGRVQPFGVYVPTTYRPGQPEALTWVLHSLAMNHNQYGATTPNFIQQACQARGSICATTLGRSPDGWYQNEARLDFFEVWRQLASDYTLDPTRTVISGYSMGGYAAYELGLSYPSLFAGALVLAGPPVCGIDTGAGVAFPPGNSAAATKCGADGDTRPMVGNARWLPYVIADGAEDELVPVTGTAEQVQRFAGLGYRYTWFLYSFTEHNSWAVQDAFGPEAAAMGKPVLTSDPGHVSYTWFPDEYAGWSSLAPRSVYWLSRLQGRAVVPGKTSSVDAIDELSPDATETAATSRSVSANAQPDPAVITRQTWTAGQSPPAKNLIVLTLTNVAAVTIDEVAAGIVTPHTKVTLEVRTDGPARVTLLGGPTFTAAPGTDVFAVS